MEPLLLLVGDAQGWRPALESGGFNVKVIENPLEVVKAVPEPRAVLFTSATRGLVLQKVMTELSKRQSPPRVFVVADPGASLPGGVRQLSSDVEAGVGLVLEACGLERPAPPRFEVIGHPLPIRAVDLVVDEDGTELLRIQASDDELSELEERYRPIAELTHPALPQLREVDPDLHLLFELQPGVSLASVTRSHALNWPTLANLGAEVADLLAQLRAAKLVHGAVRPDFIWISEEGGLELLLAGLASPLRGRERSAKGMHTPLPLHDLPPEEIVGQRSAASDLYELGYSLFELLSRVSPFRSESSFEAVQKIRRDAPPKLAELSPGVPLAISNLIDRMLAKEPEARPTAKEVASALRPLGASDSAVRDELAEVVRQLRNREG